MSLLDVAALEGLSEGGRAALATLDAAAGSGPPPAANDPGDEDTFSDEDEAVAVGAAAPAPVLAASNDPGEWDTSSDEEDAVVGAAGQAPAPAPAAEPDAAATAAAEASFAAKRAQHYDMRAAMARARQLMLEGWLLAPRQPLF